MRTGIIGGTFDPIHNAHLMIAKKAYEEYSLDKVLFMPSPNPPHKNEDEISSVNHRTRMINLAIEGFEGFEFSDYEINKEGKVYSAETLTQYKEEHPDEELFFIIGSDSLYTMDSWYHPEIIFSKATILAAKRNDSSINKIEEKITYLKEKYEADIYIINVDISDISSTTIRMCKDFDVIKKMLPQKVFEYIVENDIYKNCKGSNRKTNSDIIADLEKVLKPNRFIHTINVAKTAASMAQALGENPNKAYLAGLLHDCAKCNSDDLNIRICKKNNVMISEFEYRFPHLLHAKAGSCLCKEKYGIIDEDIINAVKYHTTGRPGMSLLEKIIFTADYIEPGRTKQPNLDMLREMAYSDIDKTVYIILKDTIDYLKSDRDSFDLNTVEAFNYYEKLIKGD